MGVKLESASKSRWADVVMSKCILSSRYEVTNCDGKYKKINKKKSKIKLKAEICEKKYFNPDDIV